MKKELLLEFISKPRKSPEIAKHFGISQRNVRIIVRSLVLKGEPIIEGDFGYLKTDDPGFVLSEINHLEKQIRSRVERIKALKKTHKRMTAGLFNE